MEPKHRLPIVVSLAAFSFLGACSSGSGGGPPPVPTEPVEITEDNATQVAAGMPMTTSLIDFQEFMSFETLTADGAGTYPCPDGGSITAGFAIDAAPVGEVSTGDRFYVNFNHCMMDASSIINGGIVLNFNTITGDWEIDTAWQVDLGFEINNLTFSSGPVTGIFDGSWTQDASYDTGDATFELAGDFTTSVNDGTGWKSAALSGLDLTWSYDATATEATYGVDGVFASTEAGGSVTVETVTPFVIRDVDEFPYTGSMRMTGAGNSRLTITALDENFVRLDVDADGDGIDEFSVTVSWFDLEA